MKAVEHGLRKGLRIVGEKFERLEIFLPEMMLAAKAADAVKEILEPALRERSQVTESPGIVVLGTAKGDIHTIGKDILGMLLRLAGFEVVDLGTDVPASVFYETAKKVTADIIAVSGDRDKFAVMVGGAPTTQEWAEEIGADGYAETANGGVELALRLVDRPGVT
jgi:methanogenic corrinoid protein MtbC1